jgi:arylsulfatase A-like enzyme
MHLRRGRAAQGYPEMVRARRVYVGLALLLLLQAPGHAQAGSVQTPNVVFIMADDLGHGDLGVTNARQRNTPNIDQLAAEGLHLTNGYANAAICSPTRTALLTGSYQFRVRTGLQEPIGAKLAEADTLPYGQPTLASAFAERGYATSLVGKWHLGAPPRHGPLQYGYQSFFGIPKGAADYFRHRANLAQDEPTDGLFAGDQRRFARGDPRDRP